MENSSISGTSKKRIAIYDMDKTVTRRATYTGFLVHMAMHRAPWRLMLAPTILLGALLYVLKIWSRGRLKEFSQALLIGRRVPRNEWALYANSYADKVIANNIYPQARARIADEKAAGYTHVIATASYRLYVDAIAEKLGFDYVIATDLASDARGNILASIDGDNCYDNAKLDKVKQWIKQQGLSRADCHIRAYSDHVSDAPLLDYADEAYATNPHPPLTQMAQAKGWQILDWRGTP